MLSVFKKLTKSGDDGANTPTPMSSALQKKFSRGVDYNMKILIKGDRNVGKTCLLQRLQGGAFIEEYRPTDEIQAAGINWAYKNTNHVVKVDVWEVVDKGKSKKKCSIPLKIDNNVSIQTSELETPTLDATFLDVYKDADGVILMFDITKNWTYEYVVKELSKIPKDIPVIILGNHCDMQHHRQVHKHHIDSMMDMAHLTRAAITEYCEASMRNGFGLRFLHRFFNVPFLALQRRTLLGQLQSNSREAEMAQIDLKEYKKCDEFNYDLFVQRLAERRGAAVKQTAPINNNAPSIVLGGGKPILPSDVNPLVKTKVSEIVQTSPPEQQPKVKRPSGEEVGVQALPAELQAGMVLINKQHTPTAPKKGLLKMDADDLESFCAGVLDNSFLEETAVNVTDYQKHSIPSDSDDDTANPMVTSALEDFEAPEMSQTPPEEHRPARQTKTLVHQFNKESVKLEDDYSVDERIVWSMDEKEWQLADGLDLGGRRSPEGVEYPDGIETNAAKDRSPSPNKVTSATKFKEGIEVKEKKSKDKKEKKDKKKKKKEKSTLLEYDEPGDSRRYNSEEYDVI